MKRSNYLLTIDKPCAESWAEMAPTDSGRFCDSCAKNVTDFSNLSDDQVLAILKKSNGNLCGRLEKSQLNRYLVSKTEPSHKSRFYKLFTGVLLLTAASHSFAKTGIKREVATKLTTHSASDFKITRKAISRQPPTDSLKNVFRGRVVDSLKHLPVSGVTILLEGTEFSTVTNMDGKFDLAIPSKLVNNQSTLIISFIGYKTDRLTVNPDDFSDEKNIVLTEDTQLLGEVVYVGNYTVHNRKWWQFWKKKYCK